MDNKDSKKQAIAYFWAIVTIIATIIVGAGVILQSTHILPLFLAVVAILFGPVCGILYLAEIKKGILSVDGNEEE